MDVKIVVPVWGQNYVDTFLKLSLPTQLSPLNIPKISKKHKVIYVIYTTRKDKKFIESSDIFIRLSKYANIEFSFVNNIFNKKVYTLYRKIHYIELKKSSKKDECVFLFNSDMIMSDQFMYRAIKIMKTHKVINVFCPRTLEEPIKKFYANNANSNYHLKITAQTLNKLWFQNCHPLMKYHFLPKKNKEQILPATFIWQPKKNVVYVRSFHLHPVLVYPKNKKINKFRTTIDAGPIYHIFNSWEIYTEKSNKDLFIIELSPKQRYYNGAGYVNLANTYVGYFQLQDRFNFKNFESEIVVGDLSLAEIKKLRQVSDQFIATILLKYLYSNTIKYTELLKVFNYIVRFIYSKRNLFPNFLFIFMQKIYRKIIKTVFKSSIDYKDYVRFDS